MRLTSRHTRALLPALLTALACNGLERESPHTEVPDDGALLRLDRDSIAVGFMLGAKLVASRTDSAGNPKPAPLLWISGNDSILRVDSGGFLVGTGVGRTWAFVSDRRHLDSARVTVWASYTTINAGTDATCALSTIGRPLCWGWNAVGSLGDGSERDAHRPVPVAGLRSFDELVTGAGSTCGLAGGTAYCWGYNGVGQLGDGSIMPRSAPVRIADTLLLSRLTLGAGATTCAFDNTQTTLCWGWNGWGQLLNGTLANAHRPIVLHAGVSLTAIATGGGHVCGLDQAGRAWCWGRNDRGQLGDGGTESRGTPATVAGAPALVALAAGVVHTCGRTAGGQVWCWGDNQHGQLAAPVTDYSTTPVLAADGMVFDTIATSAYHTCALAAQTAWCWGDNAYGQLGRAAGGGTGNAAEPVAGPLRFRAVSAGVYHTCAITTDGVAYCWGRNLYGALGDGGTLDQGVPTRVAFQP